MAVGSRGNLSASSEVKLLHAMDSTQIPAIRRLSARITSCMIPLSLTPHLHTRCVPTVFRFLLPYIRYHFRILKIVKAMLKTRYLAFLSRMCGSVAAQSQRELYLRSISIPFH
jgi:hypothetical protein